MHVIIVGAGLGGLSLAQCLRKQGISFEIFERDADENSRFQGWAIALYGYVAHNIPFLCRLHVTLANTTPSCNSALLGDLASSFPSDLPDLREATNHLAPLTLPAQICMYAPGIQGRVGVEVRRYYPRNNNDVRTLMFQEE